MTRFEELAEAALGKRPLTLLFKDVNLVNVYTGEVYRADVGVLGDRVAYVGDHSGLKASEVVDGSGRYLIPGLIDSHLHVESSMVTPCRFAEAVLPRGVTTAVADPHEIANVLGVRGVKAMVENSRGLPLKLYFWAPTCVPPLPGFETSGAEIRAEDVAEMLGWEGVIGLGEVMDYHGVLNLDPRIVGIVNVGRSSGVLIDGHAPMLRGRMLNAYVSSGVEADHENFGLEEVVEKARLGLWVEVRRNLAGSREFIETLAKSGVLSRLILTTDDTSPDLLVENGHLDELVRSAIANGLDPIEAVRSATLRPAQRLRLYDRGGLAPGKLADMILLKSLERFEVDRVYSDGRLVAKEGRLVAEVPIRSFPDWAKRTVKAPSLRAEDFRVEAPIPDGWVYVNVIVVRGFETFLAEARLPVENGFIKSSEYVSAAVIERHGRGGGFAKAFIDGLGMEKGAVASTVAHDTHNIVVLGKSTSDMALAYETLRRKQGGYVAVLEGRVLALLRLPVAGLMSEEPVEEVSEKFKAFRKAEKTLGLSEETPIPLISLLTLPVIPHVRVTDKGLFDVDKGSFIPLVKRFEKR